ncbi:hypothetical protein Golomagni_01783 [Golovinomyces magnicellulatus]|nr:hypothetical protein Golomagni_01783 [Golovinomyces magnicellulatus]
MSTLYQTAWEAVRWYVEILPLKFILALACGVWYLFIIGVQSLGVFKIYRHYSSIPKAAISPTLEIDHVPNVTILRPVKGKEPFLYDCLAATFRQNYPREKLSISFCVSDASDPAIPILRLLLHNFSGFNARIFIEEDDLVFDSKNSENPKLGPNPKIRNLRRGYLEAKSDIIWILDCNVWVAPGVIGRMVDKLCGFAADGTSNVPYKLVHQLPLIVDTVETHLSGKSGTSSVAVGSESKNQSCSANSNHQTNSPRKQPDAQMSLDVQTFGGRLEEAFMGSSHAKFYTAINTVSVAPCIVGKSNMFRKSHLNYLTRHDFYSNDLDSFSHYICEDHIIGDVIWKKKVLEEKSGRKFYRHGLVVGDLAIQPIAGMSISNYIRRRVRWLRARKWTVLLATLVEPGVEPLLCSVHGAYALTSLPWLQKHLGIPPTILGFLAVWALSVSAWMLLDTITFYKLHSGRTIEFNAHTPPFVHKQLLNRTSNRRSITQWILAWIGRELLALPIWIWACLCGNTVVWRGKKFRINYNMTMTEELIHSPQKLKLDGEICSSKIETVNNSPHKYRID